MDSTGVRVRKKDKLLKLQKILRKMRRVVVAFSGGLDSTFLLKVALDTLGKENVFAVIAKSETYPQREYKSAKRLAKQFSANCITITTNEIDDKTFLKNPVNRCYHCKKELFGRLVTIAAKSNFHFVIDGSNHDDKKDLRYGSKAAKELGVKSPLAEAGIGKDDIKRLSRRMQLSTWNKPPFACLASRFPYHQKITKKRLKEIDKAEEILYKYGLKQVRVRTHKDIARIEVISSDIGKILSNQKRRENITKKLKRLGFQYITLDLEGYRSGSMNEVLRLTKKKH